MPTCENGVKENTYSYFLKNAAQLLYQMTEPTSQRRATKVCPFPSIFDNIYFNNLSNIVRLVGKKQSGFVICTSMGPAEIFSCYFIITLIKSYIHHLATDTAFFFYVSF